MGKEGRKSAQRGMKYRHTVQTDREIETAGKTELVNKGESREETAKM